jgi:hypothetical protein
MIYRAREAQFGYGRPLGILALEERIPCPPGTPGNPTTFPHTVCYEIVRGVDTRSLAGPGSAETLQSFRDAARTLVDKGASALVGNCGLMIVHQAALSQEFQVPVLMSSLLQIPLISGLFGPEAAVGIIASSSRGLREEHLRLAGVTPDIRTAVATMDGRPNFQATIVDESGELDFDKVETEIVDVAEALVATHPEVRAILFECVDLPPYAAAVQGAVGLPVFDITTLVGFTLSGLVRRPFTGVY